MKNYTGSGNKLTLTAPAGGVTTGVALLIGSLLVVAESTAAAGATFVGVTTGEFTYAKVSAQAWAEGAKVYWDDTAKNFTTTATGNTLVGVAAAAAANPSSTGSVRLDGVVR